MIRLFGWLLFLFGLVFAIGASINAEKFSQIYSDSYYRAYSGLYDVDGKVRTDDMRLALNALARELDSSRRIGYILVSFSMAVGGLILNRPRITVVNTGN